MKNRSVAYFFPAERKVALSNLAPHFFVDAFRSRYQLDLLFSDEEVSLFERRRLRDFALIFAGFSYETGLLSFVRHLALQGVPVLKRDRPEGRFPCLIAGGVAASLNPLPLLDICDAVLCGEAEVMYDDLCRALDDPVGALEWLPSVPYAASEDAIPMPVRAPAGSFAVSSHPFLDRFGNEFGDRVVLELDRGCVGNCHFCAARHLYGSRREADQLRLLAAAEKAFARGKGIALLGTAVESVSCFPDLIDRAIAAGKDVSLSSVRIAGFTPEVAQRLSNAGVKTVTFAPESMRESTRRHIGKPLSDEVFRRALAMAGSYRFKVKLYLMAGLPETDAQEEAEAIVSFLGEMMRQKERIPLSLSIAPFCPKPGTPFADRALMPKKEYERFREIVERGVRSISPRVSVEWFSWRESLLQTAVGRFDVDTGSRFLAAYASAGTVREAERRTGIVLNDFIGGGDGGAR